MNDTTNPAATRKRRLQGLALVVAIGFVAYLAWYLLVARFYEDTDDAYVGSDIVQVTSEVPGTVLAIHADDTQNVERGQVLVELDPADAQIAMQSAEADLARAVRNVRGLFAQGGQLQAQIAERETALRRAQDDYNRRKDLLKDGAVSTEELSHAQDTISSLRSSLAAAREQANATQAQTSGTRVATHPQVMAAAAQLRNAALSLHRTKLTAAVTGVIARRGVQLGQRVAQGTPLMAVVPLDDVWVDANFKEVQLEDMRVGQPVTLHADLYGSGVDYHGKIAGLSAGSGAAFALLPAQNATGNWIKIVQRVPVRITLDPEEIKAHPLRVGLSMKAKVDIHDTSGALIATQVRSVPQPVQVGDGDDAGVDALIAKIIIDNEGAPQPGLAAAAPQHIAE